MQHLPTVVHDADDSHGGLAIDLGSGGRIKGEDSLYTFSTSLIECLKSLIAQN